MNAAAGNDLSVPQLERVYEELAGAIDQVGEAQTPMFLVKLALLSAQEIGDADRVVKLIESALADL